MASVAGLPPSGRVLRKRSKKTDHPCSIFDGPRILLALHHQKPPDLCASLIHSSGYYSRSSRRPDAAKDTVELIEVDDLGSALSGELVTASFSGRITSTDGAGLPGIIVTAGASNATTDADGAYALPNATVTEDHAYLTVRGQGFVDGSRTLLVRDGSSYEVDVELLSLADAVEVDGSGAATRVGGEYRSLGHLPIGGLRDGRWGAEQRKRSRRGTLPPRRWPHRQCDACPVIYSPEQAINRRPPCSP